MTDEEVFKMIRGPLFETELVDETYWGHGPIIARFYTKVSFYGDVILKIAGHPTKEGVVNGIRTAYKIGGLIKAKSYIDKIVFPISDSDENFDLIMYAKGALSRARY